MPREHTSRDSIIEATKSRSEFSAHGGLGAAGYISQYDQNQPSDFLSRAGETAVVNPPADGLQDFTIGVAWDNVEVARAGGFFKRLFRQKILKKAIDLDLGCLYELQDQRRGAIQAFGEMYGALDEAPFIALSGDERTGNSPGHDEVIRVSGGRWDQIRKILIYIYIYKGADNWDAVRPQVQVRVPGEKPMVVMLQAKRDDMALCAVAMLENVRGGIKMTSCMEYFPGHSEMDRAFGFGLEWAPGQKRE